MPMKRNACPVACLCFLLLALSAAGAQENEIRGIVRDMSGAPISHADVRLASGGVTHTSQTDESGRFSFPNSLNEAATVIVSAQDFRTTQVSIAPHKTSKEIQVVLRPEGMKQ